MAGTHIDGDPTTMNAYSTKLTAPAMPASMARLGTPPNLAGLFEGIAMSLLDKAATAELAAFITKVSEDMITDSTKVQTAAVTYTAADVTSALTLADSTIKLAQQGLSLVQQLTGSLNQTGTSGKDPVETLPADQPVNHGPQPID